MKTFKLFLMESDNLDFEISGDWTKRIFATGKLKETSKTWLDVGDKPVVEATYDITENGECLYRNRIDAHKKGRGYAVELHEYVFKEAKKHGIKYTKGYIENSNADSKSMARKLGLKELEKSKDGAIWGKDL